MTNEEFLNLLGDVAEKLDTDPVFANNVDLQMAMLQEKYPDFFDRINNKPLGKLSRDDIDMMFDILKNDAPQTQKLNFYPSEGGLKEN